MAKIVNLYNSLNNQKQFKKISSFLKTFIDSDFYILLLMIASIINWKLKVVWPIFIIVIFLFILIYIFRINRIRLIPIILFSIIALRLEDTGDYLWPSIIAMGIVLPIIVIDLFNKPIMFDNKIFIGMLFILIAKCFSLVNTPEIITTFYGIIKWLFYMLAFLYFYNKREFDSIENNRQYLVKSLTFLGVAIFIEIFLLYLENGKGTNIISFFSSGNVNFGWAAISSVATIYLIIIPMLMYCFSMDQKHYSFIIMVFISLIALLLMLSRGAYLAIILTILPLLIYFISNVDDKTKFVKVMLFIFIFLLFGLLVIGIPTGIVKSFFDVLNERGLSFSGQQLLYNIGLKVFQRYPLFGGGANTASFYLAIATEAHHYENYLIHTLASMGLFGLIAFIYYLYQIFKQATIIEKYNIYGLFVVLNMVIQGLFDTTFYNPLVMILLSLIFPLMMDRKKLDFL